MSPYALTDCVQYLVLALINRAYCSATYGSIRIKIIRRKVFPVRKSIEASSWIVVVCFGEPASLSRSVISMNVLLCKHVYGCVVYLSWMIVQPQKSSQRVDDLLIKRTHLFR